MKTNITSNRFKVAIFLGEALEFFIWPPGVKDFSRGWPLCQLPSSKAGMYYGHPYASSFPSVTSHGRLWRCSQIERSRDRILGKLPVTKKFFRNRSFSTRGKVLLPKIRIPPLWRTLQRERESGTDRSSAPQLTATSSSCRESRLPNGSFSGLPVASVVPACDSLLTLFLQARKTVGGWFGCLSLISENQQQCGTGHYRGWKRKSTNVLWLWKDGIFRIHYWGISLLVLETCNYFQNKAVRCPSNLFCRVSDGPMQTHFSWADGSSCYCLLWQVHSKTPGGNVTLISLRTKSVTVSGYGPQDLQLIANTVKRSRDEEIQARA